MKKSLYFLIIFLLGLSITAAAYFLDFWKGKQSFPRIAAGDYIGTLTSSDESSISTFYINKQAGEQSIFVAVFAKDWVPAVVDLVEGKEAYQAINIWHKGTSYTLYGSSHDEGYDGSYVSSSQDEGSWSIRKIKDIEQDVSIPASFSLESWLQLRVPYVTLKNQFQRAESQIKQDEETFYRLQKAVSDSELLKAHAKERKQLVLAELEDLNNRRLSTGDEVYNLVEQLDVMRRVSKRGRVVDLARRINQRENKWYRVNWDGAQEQEFSLDEQEIDLEGLETSFKEASEKRDMLREIQSERQRVRLLRRQLGADEPREEKRSSGSLLDRIWGRD